MPPLALVHVPVEHGPALGVLQAELAEKELGQPGVLLGKRAGVPGLDLVAAEHDGRGIPAARAARTRRRRYHRCRGRHDLCRRSAAVATVLLVLVVVDSLLMLLLLDDALVEDAVALGGEGQPVGSIPSVPEQLDVLLRDARG